MNVKKVMNFANFKHQEMCDMEVPVYSEPQHKSFKIFQRRGEKPEILTPKD
jgi:hypothetical protein